MTLQEVGLKPTTPDLNVWIRAEIMPDGYEYCEMLLVYVDEIMIVSRLVD